MHRPHDSSFVLFCFGSAGSFFHLFTSGHRHYRCLLNESHATQNSSGSPFLSVYCQWELSSANTAAFYSSVPLWLVKTKHLFFWPIVFRSQPFHTHYVLEVQSARQHNTASLPPSSSTALSRKLFSISPCFFFSVSFHISYFSLFFLRSFFLSLFPHSHISFPILYFFFLLSFHNFSFSSSYSFFLSFIFLSFSDSFFLLLFLLLLL